MEASRLLQGDYSGPVERKWRRRDNSNGYVLQWLRDIIVPPLVFVCVSIGTAVLHGPGKLLSVTVGVLEALLLARTIVEVFRGKWKNVCAGLMFVVLAGVVSMLNNAGLVMASVFCLWCAGMTYVSARKGRGSSTALFIVLLVAAGLGAVFGMYVQMTQLSPFNTYQSMATYMNIDPSMDKGGAYRDAGSVYFKEGTHIDIKRAIAVKSKDLFCLAPLIRLPIDDAGKKVLPAAGEPLHPPASGTIDWWVVGMNCCDPSGERFVCGQTGVSTARSGLRLVRDDLRHFYSMGVAEWSSKYSLPTKHPLFFEWVTDPLGDVGALKIVAWDLLLRGAETFAALNILMACFGVSVASMVELAADRKG